MTAVYMMELEAVTWRDAKHNVMGGPGQSDVWQTADPMCDSGWIGLDDFLMVVHMNVAVVFI